MINSIRNEIYQSIKSKLPSFWLRLAGATVFFLSFYFSVIMDAYPDRENILVVLSCYLAYLVLTECTNSYFIQHIDEMITNLPQSTVTQLKSIYPLLIAGFLLSSAFFIYSLLAIPTKLLFVDPLPMFSGAAWVLIIYYYYSYILNRHSSAFAFLTTDDKGKAKLLNIPSIILAKVHDFNENVTIVYDVKGDYYLVEGNQLQTMLDSYFGYKFEKKDRGSLISKDFWKDKNKPLSKRFYLLRVRGGLFEIGLSAFRSVVREGGLYTVMAQSDIFFMPASEQIDVLFPADQFEVEDDWAGPIGQDRVAISRQTYELLKKYIMSSSLN